jgi:hypothetical protein
MAGCCCRLMGSSYSYVQRSSIAANKWTLFVSLLMKMDLKHHATLPRAHANNTGKRPSKRVRQKAREHITSNHMIPKVRRYVLTIYVRIVVHPVRTYVRTEIHAQPASQPAHTSPMASLANARETPQNRVRVRWNLLSRIFESHHRIILASPALPFPFPFPFCSVACIMHHMMHHLLFQRAKY